MTADPAGAIGRRAVVAAAALAGLAAAAPRPAAAGQRLQVAMLMVPDMTAMDLVGPQLILATLPDTDVHLVAAGRAPVVTDSGLAILPTLTLADCPAELDVLFVPGGLKGTTALIGDDALLGFLRDRGSRARLVASVCTGALALAAAGLLRGYRATGHWYIRDLLRDFGAEPVAARVVEDRDRMTGAGVTAGLDFALRLSARLRGEAVARTQTLVFEYDPQPPFDTGSPAKAGPELTARVLERRGPAIEAARQAALAARAKWPA